MLSFEVGAIDHTEGKCEGGRCEGAGVKEPREMEAGADDIGDARKEKGSDGSREVVAQGVHAR